MSGLATLSRIAFCRRKLAAVLFVFMLATGLFHTHFYASSIDAKPQNAVLLAQVDSDDADERAGAKPVHAANHCACKDLPLRFDNSARVALKVQPAQFAGAAPYASRPGSLMPPMEPPRA